MLCARTLSARIHAICGSNELVVDIEKLRIVGGSAPDRVRNLVLDWVSQHQKELLAAWQTCLSAGKPAAIAPLR